jgi:5,10-methylenetetrahydromethanopterin reductase
MIPDDEISENFRTIRAKLAQRKEPIHMTALRIACSLPPSKDAPAYARLAEELGYDGFYLYDSPALYTDVWASLARVAEATSRITIGPGVSVPSLRNPMVTASAIAAVAELAPGRMLCGFGTGYTARLTMGQKALRWEEMRRFFTQLRALLRGDIVEIDGGAAQMIQSPGFAPARPIDVPLLAAVSGPKGIAVARDVADGIFCDGRMEVTAGFDRCLQLAFGTVLEPGEDHSSPRVKAAAGPMYATGIHALWEMAPQALAGVPGGAEWKDRIEAERPARERHLLVHEGHMAAVSDRDQPLVEAAGPGLLAAGWTGTKEQIRARFFEAESKGVTEVVMAMADPDIPAALRAFARAANR